MTYHSITDVLPSSPYLQDKHFDHLISPISILRRMGGATFHPVYNSMDYFLHSATKFFNSSEYVALKGAQGFYLKNQRQGLNISSPDWDFQEQFYRTLRSQDARLQDGM
jgi:hypothetical protein